MAYTTAAEDAKKIRAELKAKGWTQRDVSVRARNCGVSDAIDVKIKTAKPVQAEVERIVAKFDHVDRCNITGEILGGGNRFTHVGYTEEAKAAIGAEFVEPLRAAVEKLRTERDGLVEVVPGVSVGWAVGGGWAQIWTDRAGKNFHAGGSLAEGAFQVALAVRDQG